MSIASRAWGRFWPIPIGSDTINGTTHEEQAAEWVKANVKKPMAGFIAGATAPPGRRMGHAGAIVSGGKGTAAAKQAAMEEAGIEIAATPSDMADALIRAMKR